MPGPTLYGLLNVLAAGALVGSPPTSAPVPPVPPPVAATAASSSLPIRVLPEPATLIVVGSGILGLAIFSRRRKRRE